MRITKTRLCNWIAGFIEITGDIWADERKLLLGFGKGVLICPQDIFAILKQKSVIEKSGDSWVFHFTSIAGEANIEVVGSRASEGLKIIIKKDSLR